jgi:hypothetical protein
MAMTRTTTYLLVAAALALGGCTKQPAYLYGRDFTKLEYAFVSVHEGVYPDTSILDDDNNPFKLTPATHAGKPEDEIWVIQSMAGPVAAYYAWATDLAHNPAGEPQYWVGFDLQQIHSTGQAAKGDLPNVATQAVNAYQSMLDNYPMAVTYDSNGKNPSELATRALRGLVDLGGTPKNGWVLVMGSDGHEHAVKQ